MSKQKKSASQQRPSNRTPREIVSASGKTKYNFSTALSAWRIIQQILPNPDIVLQRRGQSQEIYRELLSDGHLTACLESRESVTLGYDWRIERNGTPSRLYSAIENWFFNIIERKTSVGDLSRDELTSNLLDVIYWGYQPTELTWDISMGHWVPFLITPKPPEWFKWWIDTNGVPELRFLSQQNMVLGEAPPDPWTLICPRVKATYENPYGRGVAGRCFWPIVFKRASMEFWVNFLERYGTPWVLGKIVNGTATEPDLTAFAEQLKTLIQDAVIAVSGNREVEILESKNSAKTADGFRLMCDYMDSQMSKTILGHTLSTDAGNSGSYAATKGAMTVRSDFIARDITMMTSIWNDVINLIALRNGYGNISRPRAIPYHANEVETEMATRDEALNRAGVTLSEKYFIRTYHNLEPGDILSINDPVQAAKDQLATQSEIADKQIAHQVQIADKNNAVKTAALANKQATKPEPVKKDNVLNMQKEKKNLASAK